MKTSYQTKYSPMLLCGISMWTASPMTTYSTPVNPRLETRLSTWMLKPSAYVFKEPGSQAGTRTPFANISMDLISATI
jgi:hypothetical protein